MYDREYIENIKDKLHNSFKDVLNKNKINDVFESNNKLINDLKDIMLVNDILELYLWNAIYANKELHWKNRRECYHCQSDNTKTYNAYDVLVQHSCECEDCEYEWKEFN